MPWFCLPPRAAVYDVVRMRPLLASLLVAAPLAASSHAQVVRFHSLSAVEGGAVGPLQDGDRFGVSAARLGDPDGDGTVEVTLGAPWPNPAQSRVTAAFPLAGPCPVSVHVIDALGRVVATPVDGPLPAGSHRIAIPVRARAPGAYVVRLVADSGSPTRTLTVVR